MKKQSCMPMLPIYLLFECTLLGMNIKYINVNVFNISNNYSKKLNFYRWKNVLSDLNLLLIVHLKTITYM